MPTLLDEPVECGKFWCSRRKREAAIVLLHAYEGRIYLDVRRHFLNTDGKFCPSKKGVTLAVDRLPHLVKAINKAHKIAAELGLIEGEAGHG